MKSNTVGFIIHFDEEQRNALLKISAREGSFSDTFSVPDWKMGKSQIVLLSFDENTIDFICLAQKKHRVATAKFKVEFYDIIKLDAVAIDELEAQLPKIFRQYFIKSSSGHGGKIPNKTWKEIISGLKNLRPNIADEINRLISLEYISEYNIIGANTEILMQERDSLGVALDIFDSSLGLRKKVLKAWSPGLDNIEAVDEKSKQARLSRSLQEMSSFCSQLPKTYVDEEMALQHDLMNWEGAKASLKEFRVCKFSIGGRLLEVVYANRNALERTLGVDLIYYNKNFHSYVLVQYKLMNENTDEHKFCYRPDDQLEKEISRMKEFKKMSGKNIEIQDHKDFRINSDGFLFKLIPNRGLNPASGQLIPGMYLTHEYMDFLLSENGPKGKLGGRLISFENSPRYLSNTEFSGLVNKGWVGTRNSQSNQLKDLINHFLQTGKAVMIAVEDLKINSRSA